MLNLNGRTAFDESHDMFRDTVRRFFEQESKPHHDRWEEEGLVEPEFWLKCGEAGLLCPTVPEEYGGLGLDFGFNAVIDEEHSYCSCPAGLTLQNDIIADYFIAYGSEEQKQTYLPKMVSGEIIGAIAMTEPGAGSDLQAVKTTARREGDDYIINGNKTYITNGQTCGVVIVVAKTDVSQGARGTSLILVDTDTPGFARGRNLDKIGLHGADTSELFFQDVHVPATQLLGEEGAGFFYLMNQLPQERLSIAISAQGAAQRAFDLAVEYTKDRPAFGGKLFDLQNTRFVLAGLKAKIQAGWAQIDWAIARHAKGELSAAEASAAKLFHTELQWEVCDAALQLHGGAGYMNEYEIARLWRDARVTRIFGGASEIMKEVVARSI
ncbi:acyl-CoA dehydrogenase family protein [Maricaulis parjimensis]|uniref:acyl-CoA dehydrogenase family protein n=1 Tax=Maricaulis parjimensis TaxID=144023 RepID=UPI00193957C7|nr:acyl-CoA dehydrogenase family protein [Maricaulis parjimensis]